MEADVERGEYVDPRAGREKFGAVAAKYLRLRQVGGGSRRRYESVNRNHVEPAFGSRSVKSIRPSDILEWLQGPMAEMSESVRITAYLIVRGTFELAVADGMRRDNPAASKIIPRPQAKPSTRKPWDAATVWRVAAAMPEPYRAILQAEAGLGLRQGCALALAEEDIDLEAGTVTIRRQLSRQGTVFVFKAPKGGKERTVPLSRGMAQVLQAHMKAYPPRPYTLPWMNEQGKIKGERTCRILFRWHGDDPRTHDGHIIAAAFDRMVWKPALHAAGLIPAPVRDSRHILRYAAAPYDGQHAARHFYSVTLQDAGVSLAGVMEFMGHSRKGKVVTIGIYGHVTEETFEQARVAIDRTLFRLHPVREGSAGTVTELRRAK
jgi:integrase